MAFEAITSAVLNALGSGNLTQALINNAISDKPASGLGSDDPLDALNIQVQYPPPGTIPTTAVGAYPGPNYPEGIEVPTPATSTWDSVRGWLSNLIPAVGAQETPTSTEQALTMSDMDLDFVTELSLTKYPRGSDEEARVLAQRNAYDAAQKQFATGDFDMGSLAAQSALPINSSRPDLWRNEVVLDQPDPPGSFTGVSLDDTYAAHRAGDLEGVLFSPFPANLAYYGGRIATPGYEPPIESTGLLEGIAARKFLEPGQPVYGGSFVKSLVDQGKVTPEAGQEYIDRINTIQVDKGGDLRADVVYGALDPADPGAAGTAGKPTEAIINDVLTNWGNVGEAKIKIVPTDLDYSKETNLDYPQEIWDQLRDNYYFPPGTPTSDTRIPGQL